MSNINIYSDINNSKKIRIGYQGPDSNVDTVYFENGYMFNKNDITNYAHDFSDVSNAQDNARHLVVNKRYVDNLTSGITYIESVDVASDKNFTDPYNATENNWETFRNLIKTSLPDSDLSNTSRVLLKNQTDVSLNGIYTVKFESNAYSLNPYQTGTTTWNEYHNIVDNAGLLQPGIYIFDKFTSTAYVTYCEDVNTSTTDVCVTEYSSSNSKLNAGAGLYKNYDATDGFTFDVRPKQETIREIISTDGLYLNSTNDLSLNSSAILNIDAATVDVSASANINLKAVSTLDIDAAIIDISSSTSLTMNSSGDMSLISYSDLDLTATTRVDVDAANIDLTATDTLNVDAVIVDISGSTSLTMNSSGDMSLISYSDLDLTATARVDVDAANIDLTASTTLNVDAAIVDISGSTSVTINSSGDMSLISYSDLDLTATARVDVDAANIDLIATDTLNVDAAIVDISSSTSLTMNSSGDMSLISYSDLDLTATARVDVDAANIDLTATDTLNVDAAIVDISGSTSVTINSSGDMSLISYSDLDLTATTRVDVDAANIDLTATDTLNVDAAIVDISGSTSVTINSSGDMSLISYSDLDLTATARVDVDAANIDLTATDTLNIDAAIVDISGSTSVTINSSGDMSLISYSDLDLTATSALNINAATLGIVSDVTMTGNTTLIGDVSMTLAPYEKFRINTDKFIVDESGNCDMSTSRLTVLEIHGATSFTDSDIRLKENINNIPLGLTFVNNLQPKLYNYNHTESKNIHYGLIAQDVIELLNNNNIDHTKGSLVSINNDKYSLNYTEFIPILMNSVKELKNQVDELKSELDILKNK